MVTISSHADAEGNIYAISKHPLRCRTCVRRIVWMRTCLGRILAFEADPVPRELDDGTGWVPGKFPYRGRLVTCLAPLPNHPAAKRKRVPNVMHLHACRRAA